MTINTDEFVREMAKNHQYTIKDAYMVLADFEETVADIIRRGDTLHLHGFIDFAVKESKSKQMVCVADGKVITTKPKSRLKLSPCAALKRAIADYNIERKNAEVGKTDGGEQ